MIVLVTMRTTPRTVRKSAPPRSTLLKPCLGLSLMRKAPGRMKQTAVDAVALMILH